MQNFEIKDQRIKERFELIKKNNPEQFNRRLNFSWSIWMFGIERFEDSVKRLKNNGINYVEIKGDRHTAGSGIPLKEMKRVLADYDMKVSGACGMFSNENDLSSSNVYSVQNAIDYIERQVEFLAEVGGTYMIVVPSAVGRPNALDGAEFIRSVNALKKCADFFKQHGIKAAVEPIRSAEVSLVHTIDDAICLIKAVGNNGVQNINADTYHMLLEESHIGEAILKAGDHLVNLHLADSNRDAVGSGMIDFDTVIRATYIIGMNKENRFVTPEPLGPFPVPYVLSNSPCNVKVMDKLVKDTVHYFNERQNKLLDNG